MARFEPPYFTDVHGTETTGIEYTVMHRSCCSIITNTLDLSEKYGVLFLFLLHKVE